ncbi:MAG: hypothetical protein OXC17_08110 [Aestuariivita sp.]|nr:hypothetical protein [Aestuariivita sp.]
MKPWVSFSDTFIVQLFEPIVSQNPNSPVNYPEHEILLRIMPYRDKVAKRLEVDPPIGALETLIALRPQQARSLAHQLIEVADRLEDN